MRRILATLAATATTMAGALIVPGVASADIIGGDVNVLSGIDVLLYDVLNGLSVVIGG